MHHSDELITTRDVAGVLGVSVRKVSRLVESGDLTPTKRLPIGRRGAFLFAREEVDAYSARTETRTP